jgi:hypothetical protein
MWLGETCVHSVGRSLFDLLYQHLMMDDECRAVGRMIGGRNRSTRRKPSPVSTTNSHDLGSNPGPLLWEATARPGLNRVTQKTGPRVPASDWASYISLVIAQMAGMLRQCVLLPGWKSIVTEAIYWPIVPALDDRR